MVQTHDDGDRVDGTHCSGADTVSCSDEPLRAGENVCLSSGEDRPDDHEGKECGDKYCCKRSDEEVDDFRHVLVKPLLQFTHEVNGDDDRNDMTLIA